MGPADEDDPFTTPPLRDPERRERPRLDLFLPRSPGGTPETTRGVAVASSDAESGPVVVRPRTVAGELRLGAAAESGFRFPQRAASTSATPTAGYLVAGADGADLLVTVLSGESVVVPVVTVAPHPAPESVEPTVTTLADVDVTEPASNPCCASIDGMLAFGTPRRGATVREGTVTLAAGGRRLVWRFDVDVVAAFCRLDESVVVEGGDPDVGATVRLAGPTDGDERYRFDFRARSRLYDGARETHALHVDAVDRRSTGRRKEGHASDADAGDPCSWAATGAVGSARFDGDEFGARATPTPPSWGDAENPACGGDGDVEFGDDAGLVRLRNDSLTLVHGGVHRTWTFETDVAAAFCGLREGDVVGETQGVTAGSWSTLGLAGPVWDGEADPGYVLDFVATEREDDATFVFGVEVRVDAVTGVRRVDVRVDDARREPR